MPPSVGFDGASTLGRRAMATKSVQPLRFPPKIPVHRNPTLGTRRKMADKISKAKRSWLMSRVASKHTKPERLVRSLLHRLGYRFTVNGPKNKNLPGRPDIVFPSRKIALFVHGCFWHRHPGCKTASTPKSNTAYWSAKFKRNVERDRQSETALEQQGWQVITVWECELKQLDQLAAQLINTLPRVQILNLPDDIDDRQLVAETQTRYGKQLQQTHAIED